MRHTRWRRDSLTNGRPWTVRAPMDSNSCNFNGTDAAGRMRTGHCRTGGQGVAGVNLDFSARCSTAIPKWF